jgi:flagellar assembly protein FliH
VAEGDRFTAGFAAGRQAALAEQGAAIAKERRSLQEAAESLRQAALELAEARRRAVEVEVHDVAHLALELVEALVGELPRALSAHRVAEALAMAPVGEQVVVRLHPDDLEVARGLVADVALVADPSVERGGCVVEAGPTRIDAQVAPALGRLRAALGGAWSSEVAAKEPVGAVG